MFKAGKRPTDTMRAPRLLAIRKGIDIRVKANLDPGLVEEFIFFDHPSGRTRITAAMRWKAEYQSRHPRKLSRPLFNPTP
jgi:hypothetical protein